MELTAALPSRPAAVTWQWRPWDSRPSSSPTTRTPSWTTSASSRSTRRDTTSSSWGTSVTTSGRRWCGLSGSESSSLSISPLACWRWEAAVRDLQTCTVTSQCRISITVQYSVRYSVQCPHIAGSQLLHPPVRGALPDRPEERLRDIPATLASHQVTPLTCFYYY